MVIIFEAGVRDEVAHIVTYIVEVIAVLSIVK